MSGTDTLTPLPCGTRKRKAINFTISEPILRLAQRTFAEKKAAVAAAATTADSTLTREEIHATAPVPTRTLHRHAKISAMLCIGSDGFTLSNAVESVVRTGSSLNPLLAKELIDMKVIMLRTFDKKTYRAVLDIKKCHEQLKDMLVLKPKNFKLYPCHYCQSEKCHRWNAAVGVSKFYKVYFDPVPH